MHPKLLRYFQLELHKAKQAIDSQNWEHALEHLARAHILGQKSIKAHVITHWWMFKVGISSGDVKELIGQIPRMLAAVIFTKIWVPKGNTGRANVSAFKSMPLEEKLENLLAKYQ